MSPSTTPQATAASFTLRHGALKLVHHVGLPPQLRDLDADLGETNDLGRSPEHAGIRARCEAELRKIVAPEEANARAFRGQAATVERLGGEAAVLARGDVGCTSAPGQKPEFR